ncbi:AroM family protein [Planococcus sp. SE5232]|uniref:AroM family protein n=1 Tax=unclassified Planococcus (in: firmicutes) TaxID=2662419 RepID=UPI003D6A35DD
METPKVGVLTIGQSPRSDVTPSIQQILGDEVTIIEAGGLDGISDMDMSSIRPSASDTTYISKLRNGLSVKIGKSKLLPLLQAELTELEKQTSVIIMLCTGDFPTLRYQKPILYPDKVLNHIVQALMDKGSLGIIIPLEEQRYSLTKKWDQSNLELLVEVASPYESSDIAGAAKSLKERGASMIVMDCMGYNEIHKKEAVQATGLPVLLPRTLVARIVAEYL